jgi:asparagine synthase (glutamine-hydrolysing)
MRHEMKDLILTVLLEPRTLQRGYFDPAGVRRLLDDHFRGRRNSSGHIWRLLIFELWHRNFLETFASRAAELGTCTSATFGGGSA